MRSVCLALTLALALAGCGKYGPPVRTPEKSTAPAAAAEATADDDRKESKK